jgi:hypothetical protein
MPDNDQRDAYELGYRDAAAGNLSITIKQKRDCRAAYAEGYSEASAERQSNHRQVPIFNKAEQHRFIQRLNHNRKGDR